MAGLPWRLKEDRSLVAFEKQLYPLCELLRDAAVTQGLAAMEVESHVCTPRVMQAAAS